MSSAWTAAQLKILKVFLIFSPYKYLEIMYCCVAFYLLYVKLEEQYGLARHAMSIYERATSALPDSEKIEVHYMKHYVF